MRADQKHTPYEVYCHQCKVSFPTGTRRCVHCGGRLGRERGRRPAIPPPPVLDELPEEELPTRSGMFSPLALLWIVLILGGAIYRACS